MSLVFGPNGPGTPVGGLTGVSCHRTRQISASPAHAAWPPAPPHTTTSPNLRGMTSACLRAPTRRTPSRLLVRFLPTPQTAHPRARESWRALPYSPLHVLRCHRRTSCAIYRGGRQVHSVRGLIDTGAAQGLWILLGRPARASSSGNLTRVVRHSEEGDGAHTLKFYALGAAEATVHEILLLSMLLTTRLGAELGHVQTWVLDAGSDAERLGSMRLAGEVWPSPTHNRKWGGMARAQGCNEW